MFAEAKVLRIWKIVFNLKKKNEELKAHVVLLTGIFHLLQIVRCSTGLNGSDPKKMKDRGWRPSLDKWRIRPRMCQVQQATNQLSINSAFHGRCVFSFFKADPLKEREWCCCAPTQQPLKKHYFIKQNCVLFWWNVWISYSKTKELTATEMVTFQKLLKQWN